jgi:hypothetical protein
MESMSRQRPVLLAALVWLPVAMALAAQGGPGVPASPTAPPGSPAPAHVVTEIRQTLDDAIARFDAMDGAGVLAHVSARYRTGTLTRAGIAEQLRAVFALHDQVRARVRIDEVRMVGGLAWVYSTGAVTGRLRLIGGSTPVLSWERELEVARRENGRWRLFGYQQ